MSLRKASEFDSEMSRFDRLVRERNEAVKKYEALLEAVRAFVRTWEFDHSVDLIELRRLLAREDWLPQRTPRTGCGEPPGPPG